MPVQTYNVTEYLDKKLCEVYENEAIFDKFDLQVSPSSSMVLTGSYNSSAHIIDLQTRTNTTIEVKFMDKRGKHVGRTLPYKGKRVNGSTINEDNNQVNTHQKTTMGAWHPTENTIALAKHNSLFLYTEKR